MENADQKLKQARLIFFLNLMIALWGFATFIKSINSNVEWKIICSGIGFLGFLTLTVLLLARMLKLQKMVASKANSQL